MTTFSWTILAIEKIESLNELQNVIKNIHWRYLGVGENGMSAETYGTTSIEDPSPENFISLDKVKEFNYIKWLENILGKVIIIDGVEQPSELEKIKSNLEIEISLTTKPLPDVVFGFTIITLPQMVEPLTAISNE